MGAHSDTTYVIQQKNKNVSRRRLTWGLKLSAGQNIRMFWFNSCASLFHGDSLENHWTGKYRVRPLFICISLIRRHTKPWMIEHKASKLSRITLKDKQSGAVNSLTTIMMGFKIFAVVDGRRSTRNHTGSNVTVRCPTAVQRPNLTLPRE